MKRKYEPIKNHAGIYRVLISNDGITWTEPSRGGKYAATRYNQSTVGPKRFKKHFDRFDEAKKFKAGMKEEEKTVAVQSSKYSFEQAVELYERTTLSNRASSTQARYQHYKKHLEFFKGKSIEEIDTVMIDDWIRWLKRPEYLEMQHSTRCNFKSEFSVLRAILNTYTSRVNRNYRLPFIKEHRSASKVREPALVVKDLSPDEFKRFLTALESLCKGTAWEFVYYLAVMQYSTFTRIQEATALHVEDFNFQRKEIVINKKIIFGRSRNEKTLLVSGAKANGGKVLPMSEMASRVFKEWTMRSGIRTGPLFHVKGGWPRYRWIEYRYTKALKAAGLNQSATHVLRHASLTEAQETSGDLNQTKVLAGHRSTKTTERYAKVRSNQIRETQFKLDQKLSGIFDSSQRNANEENQYNPEIVSALN